MKEVVIRRVWNMPSRWTFSIKPIRELLEREVAGVWVDPFCGENGGKYAKFTNDIERGGKDALEYLQDCDSGIADGVLYDPPYSFTQARMYGKKEYANMMYWAKVKTEIARIIKPGGKAVCFGWNTNGLGKSRNFSLKEVLVVPHGGSKNDTLVTVEIKGEPGENV